MRAVPTPDSRPAAHSSRPAYDIVLVGASTGGPSTLSAIFAELPVDFPLPILLVQHLSNGYGATLAESLQAHCRIPVQLARPFAAIEPGRVYVAETGAHLEIGTSQRMRVVNSGAINGFMPSVDALFVSAARNYRSRILAIVLTGMGNDGLAGCRALKSAGHHVVIQDETSSIVWGMPGEVYKAGCYDEILSRKGIAAMLGSMGKGGI